MAREKSNTEEQANRITHALGIVASVAGSVFLMFTAFQDSDALKFISFGIFGLSLIILYTASTLYHSAPNERSRHFLKILDHSAIYVLIAGTYTPFMTLNLKGTWGWSILTVIWLLAIAGVIFKLGFVHRFKKTSTFLYLAMGWLVVLAYRPLAASLPPDSLTWLVAGGATYSAGIIFYLWDGLRFNHAIWHLFVLGGSFCHYLAVILSNK